MSDTLSIEFNYWTISLNFGMMRQIVKEFLLPSRYQPQEKFHMDRRAKRQNLLMWSDRFCRWIISIIFLSAGIPKLFSPYQFAATIDAYAILPDVLLLPTAIVLPVLEILLAIGLLFNCSKSKIGIVVMLLFFIALLSYSIWLGLDIDCGCFGPEDPEHTAFQGLRVSLIRDIVMLLPLIYSFWYHRYRHYSAHC